MVDGDRGVDSGRWFHAVEVVAGAEGLLTGAAQGHDSNVGPGCREVDQRLHLAQQAEGERIQSLGTIQCDREHSRIADFPDSDLPFAVGERRWRVGPGFVV